MLKLFKRDEAAVELCESCGCVCDSACRATAILERARDRALERGIRLS